MIAILPQGDIFAAGVSVSGSKPHGKTFKYCPYSTQITNYNQDARIPSGEKTYHGETNGKMYVYALGGPPGWACPDNDCAFYAGTAITEVEQFGRQFIFLPSGTCPANDDILFTSSGTVDLTSAGRPIVSGTRYFEI